MRSYLVLLLLVGLFLDVLVADEYRAIQRAPLSKLQKWFSAYILSFEQSPKEAYSTLEKYITRITAPAVVYLLE